MKHRWSITVLVAALSFLSGGWLLQRGTGGDGGVYRQARLFDDVLNHVRNFYVDSIPEAELYTKATNGMLDELKDPYSVLLTGADFKDLTEKTSGNYAGLGIQIDVRDGWITVVAPLPDSPAERAGIQTGDQITEVDGKSTQGWNSDQAVKSLRGEPGSNVAILIRRAGYEEAIPYLAESGHDPLKSVPAGTEFDGGVGYISLNPVSESSAQELRDEIVAMRGKGMKAMVLGPSGTIPAACSTRASRCPTSSSIRAGSRVHPRSRAGEHAPVLRRGEAARSVAADRGSRE
jgi:carboxyl-terminal processing protease